MTQKIAILGATSHIAKGLISNFCGDRTARLFLFARSSSRIKEFLRSINCQRNYPVKDLNEFGNGKYNVIINCIGIGDPALLKNAGTAVFELTETYDNLILEYLRKNQGALYINFSSGAVYGTDFTTPIADSAQAKWKVNDIKESDCYGLAKLNAEAKHRALINFKIVDLRVFGYFSRYQDPKARFLLNEILFCVINNKEFVTDNRNIIRDYVHPRDLFSLVRQCIGKKKLNDSFDAYSKKPAAKFEILDHFKKTYGLKYKIKKDVKVASITGHKDNYYSTSRKAGKIGYTPKFASLDTVAQVAKEILADDKYARSI